jgi:hypothetical protein
MTLSGTEQPQKRILILAGPNGAGKTTFAREFLPDEAQCPTFVNADLIAAGLSPFRPELAAMRAGRLMLELIGDLVARGESFAFETTLADRGRRLGAVRKLRPFAGSARLEREAMNPKPVEQARTRELALALPALRRARQRAEEIAIATNTYIVQVEDGRIVHVKPDELKPGAPKAPPSK